MADSVATVPATWRGYKWVATTLLLFVPVQIAGLLVADRFASAIGAGSPEREQVALLATLLGGLGMLVVVPAAGWLAGIRAPTSPGWSFAAPVLLAAIANYAIFEDVRSGHVFDTDHALPEIFIPYAVLLIASAAIGHRLAGEGRARTAWAWVIRVTAAVTVGLIGLTAGKVAIGGGDFALDSPLTALILVAVGAYAVVTLRSVRGTVRR
jgi:hypothetical protein